MKIFIIVIFFIIRNIINKMTNLQYGAHHGTGGRVADEHRDAAGDHLNIDFYHHVDFDDLPDFSEDHVDFDDYDDDEP